MKHERRFSECSGSVSGHDAGGTTDGTCTWCGIPIDSQRPVNRHQPFEPSELRDAYDEHFDPDYGSLGPDEIRERYQMGQES